MIMKTTSPNITDSQSLISASYASYPGGNRHEIPVYDDGYGQLFIHRDSMGISGIVRALSWEDAYSICEDEFFPAGDDDANEEMERIEEMEDGEEKNHLQACWDESYGYRPNSKMMPDGTLAFFYSKDLNGDMLDELTSQLMKDLNIELEIAEEE